MYYIMNEKEKAQLTHLQQQQFLTIHEEHMLYNLILCYLEEQGDMDSAAWWWACEQQCTMAWTLAHTDQ